MPADPAVPSLGYAAMRSRWCLAALRAFLKRWGVYLAMAGLAFGAGATGGLAAVAAVAAWTVLPLAWVVAQAGWTPSSLGLLLVVPALQAATSVALLRALRPLLWPEAWRDSEAALPLAPQDTLRADLRVSAPALSLWWAVQAVGLTHLVAQRPPWLRQAGLTAALVWVFSQGLGWALGLWGLQRARRPVVGRGRRAGPSASVSLPTRMAWWQALLVLPPVRGVARNLGGWWLASLVLLALAPCLLWWQPGWAPGGWAAWSLAALALASRLNHLGQLQLEPLLDEASRVLPLDRRALHRTRRLLLLVPAASTAAGLLGVALLGPGAGSFRPGILAAWAVVASVSLWWASGPPPRQPDEAALRWLLSLVVQLALCTELVQ